jgi:hypothetical protein
MTGTPPSRSDPDTLTGRVFRTLTAYGKLIPIGGPWCAKHSLSAHSCELAAAIWSSSQAGASR